MKKILAAILAIFLICSLPSCSHNAKDQAIALYDSVLKTVSRAHLTSDRKLIGKRSYTDRDQYIGKYSSDCNRANGRDVIFGGASVETRRIRLSVLTEAKSGSVSIRICLGTDTEDYVPDENGIFEKEIVFEGAENYIMLDYKNFTGTVALSSAYIE